MAYRAAAVLGQKPDRATLAFNAMLGRLSQGRRRRVQHAQVGQATKTCSRKPAAAVERADVDQEAYFNHVSPFYVGMHALRDGVPAGDLRLALFRYRPLNWAAFTLILLTFVLHTWPSCTRIYISGRPPVTNLYSSAVVHRLGVRAVWPGRSKLIFRLGLGNIVAAVAGFATLLIAYFLAARRRHDHRAAGRARHAVLAGDARRLHHARLRRDVSGRPVRPALCHLRPRHAAARQPHRARTWAG